MQGGRRVIVGVTGSVGNLEALRSAAAEARRREASLVAVHAWVPPGGDLAERRWSVPELRQVWQDAAWRRLWDAFDAALGGLPDGVSWSSRPGGSEGAVPCKAGGESSSV